MHSSDTKEQINVMFSKLEHKVSVYFRRKKRLENIPEMSLWEQVEQPTSIKRIILKRNHITHLLHLGKTVE